MSQGDERNEQTWADKGRRNLMKARVRIGGVLLLVGAIGAGAAAPGAADPTAQITIEHFQFQPSALTVPAGTTVTWVNHDSDTHTVTSPTGAFGSPALETDDTFSFTFNAPGTYAYFCALHPHMKSTVVVK
jgi:plastocyanin